MRNATPLKSGAAQELRQELGALRRHSSPPPAERTRGTGEQPVPTYTAPGFRHPSPPAGGQHGRGAAEQSAAPRIDFGSGSSQSNAQARAQASAREETPLELAALERTAMRLLIIEDDKDAADYIARAFRLSLIHI